MFLTFKIGFEELHRCWFLKKSVRFRILELTIIAENGYKYEAKGKTLRDMRIELAVFLNELKFKAKTEELYFYGHYCATEHLLLESLWPKDVTGPIVIDFADELNEYAASIPDDSFGLKSDYLLFISKLPYATYTVAEKVEMLRTHTDYPILDRTNSYSYAKWIMDALNFPVFKTWKIGVGFLRNANKHINGR